MSKKDTLVDKIVNRLKNSPIIAAIIVLGVFVVALGSFTDSLRKVYSFGLKCISLMRSEEADDSRGRQIDLSQIRSKCQKEAEACLKAMRIQCGAKSKLDEIHISIERDAGATMRQWEKMIEMDATCRRTRDPQTILPAYVVGENVFEELKSVWADGDPYSALSPPKGLPTDWLICLQDAELGLASAAAKSKTFELYNRELYRVLGDLWSPNQTLISKSDSVIAPELYFQTRMKALERRHSLLKPNEENPFEICAKDPTDNVFPIGMNEDSAFLFASYEKPVDEENVRPLCAVPMLTDLSVDESSGYYRVKGPGRRVEDYSKERIHNRISILSQQVAAAKYTLRQHLGYWESFKYPSTTATLLFFGL